MTEKEAWEFLAKQFNLDAYTIYNGSGLCTAVAILQHKKIISVQVLEVMRIKIDNDIPNGWWFDFDSAGSYSPTSQKLRAKKALEYSKLCTSG